MKNLNVIIETNWKEDKPAFKNTQHLNDKLKKHYNNYDNNDISHIEKYTHDSSRVNRHLWERHNGDKWENKSAEEHVKGMDAAINKHKSPHKISVYSGVKYDPRESLSYTNTLHHPAYLSTSLSNKESYNFSTLEHDHDTNKNYKHILKINVPKNHPGAYVESHTKNPNERELILPRKTNFKYRGSTTHMAKDTGNTFNVMEHNVDVI